MTDMLDRIRSELDDRLRALRPAVEEAARLQRALDALEGSLSPDAPVAAQAMSRGRAPAAWTAPAKQTGRRRAPRGAAARAAPGQTQLRVIEQLHHGPGSTSTAVAKALGISANAAAATISRLVRQGRVQRLPTGGYAAGDVAATPAPAASAPTPAPRPAPAGDPVG